MTRIKEIASVMLKYGFREEIIHLGLGDIFSASPSSSATSSIALISKLSLQESQEKLAPAEQPSKDTGPKRLRLALQDLGPVFVKVGQLLSTRPDLLPENYIAQLRLLQDSNDSVPFEAIETTIERELGHKISELFLKFEREPLATASIGQAHIALLSDGREVVVKVQRPNIFNQIQDDLELLSELALFVTRRSQQSHRYDLPNIIDTLARTLIHELNYLNEARNTRALQKSLRSFPHIIVPDVIDAYSSKHVLTTIRIHGVKAAEASEQGLIEKDLKPIATELARSYIKQLCVDGFFHSDPHPGNLLLVYPNKLPCNSSDGKRGSKKKPFLQVKIDTEYGIGAHEGSLNAGFSLAEEPSPLPSVALIDCGMVSCLTRSFQEKLLQLLFFLSENHGERVAEIAIEMGQPLADFDEKSFRTWVTDLVSQYSRATLESMDLGHLIFRIIQAATHNGLQVPAELTMIAKTLFNLDITLIRLSPNFKLADVVRNYALEMVTEKFRQELSFANFYSQAVQVQHLVTDLPKKIDKMIDQLNDEEFELRVHIDRSKDILKAIQKVANRITMGMITAAIIIGSAIIMHIHTNFQLFGYPGIAIIGFLLASGFGAYLIISMILNDQ
ncbi:MAG: AarF/UbiB family protein [Acidobacteriota bacterium]